MIIEYWKQPDWNGFKKKRYVGKYLRFTPIKMQIKFPQNFILK